jgi:molybdopterin-containing oxidoreductase family iron-sulfur binding subunit
VCPVFATYHNEEGLNVQVYNRCIGTRFCANNCPYQVRFFNWWEPEWPESLKNQLNPDVTVRSRGIMEKCTFCVQRIKGTKRKASREGKDVADEEYERSLNPACVNACPTETLFFGDLADVLGALREDTEMPEEPVSKAGRLAKKELEEGGRGYRLLETLGTNTSVIYLKKVDKEATEVPHG